MRLALLPLSSRIIIGSLRDKVKLLCQHIHTPLPTLPPLLLTVMRRKLAPQPAFDSSPALLNAAPNVPPSVQSLASLSQQGLRSLWVVRLTCMECCWLLATGMYFI